MDKTESQHDHLAQTVSLLGSLAGLVVVIVGVIVGVYGNLGSRVQLIAILSLVVIAVYSLYMVLGRPSVLAVRRAAKAIREYYLVPRYFAGLELFVERLQRLCDRGYSDNIARILCDFPPLWGGPLIDPPALWHLAGFVDALHFMLSGSRRSKKNLGFLLRWFRLILDMYNRQCVCEPVKQVVNRAEQGLDEDKKLPYERLKRKYQEVKFGYVVFLEDYAKLVRDVNAAFGESMASDCYDRPGEL